MTEGNCPPCPCCARPVKGVWDRCHLCRRGRCERCRPRRACACCSRALRTEHAACGVCRANKCPQCWDRTVRVCGCGRTLQPHSHERCYACRTGRTPSVSNAGRPEGLASPGRLAWLGFLASRKLPLFPLGVKL